MIDNDIAVFSSFGSLPIDGYCVQESVLVPRFKANVQLHPDCDPQRLWGTPEFRADMNIWLIDFFGVSECAWKMGDLVLVHPETMERLRNVQF